MIQDFEADFLWKVGLKILNSGIILKNFRPCKCRMIGPSFHLLVSVYTSSEGFGKNVCLHRLI